MSFDYHLKVMTGLGIIGRLLPEAWALVLVGRFDDEILCAFHCVNDPSTPASMEDVRTPPNLLALERFKDELRANVQRLISEDEKRRRAELLQELQQHQQPHAFGPVAEIAQKLGISKSEVRRRKQDGTLDEMLLATTASPHNLPRPNGASSEGSDRAAVGYLKD
jgi:hypothetical protein